MTSSVRLNARRVLQDGQYAYLRQNIENMDGIEIGKLWNRVQHEIGFTMPPFLQPSRAYIGVLTNSDGLQAAVILRRQNDVEGFVEQCGRSNVWKHFDVVSVTESRLEELLNMSDTTLTPNPSRLTLG